jgi:hypothetical protein
MIRTLWLCIITLAILVANGCSSCQQSDYKELSSPDGRYVLIERELNCGALDPYRVVLSVQSRQPRLGASWLGFPHKQVFAASVRITPNTQIRWLDNSNVKVSCTGCEKYGIATRVEEWRDVKIHFDVGKAQKGPF